MERSVSPRPGESSTSGSLQQASLESVLCIELCICDQSGRKWKEESLPLGNFHPVQERD